MRKALVALSLLGLAGCTTTTGFLVENDPYYVPQPVYVVQQPTHAYGHRVYVAPQPQVIVTPPPRVIHRPGYVVGPQPVVVGGHHMGGRVVTPPRGPVVVTPPSPRPPVVTPPNARQPSRHVGGQVIRPE